MGGGGRWWDWLGGGGMGREGVGGGGMGREGVGGGGRQWDGVGGGGRRWDGIEGDGMGGGCVLLHSHTLVGYHSLLILCECAWLTSECSVVECCRGWVQGNTALVVPQRLLKSTRSKFLHKMGNTNLTEKHKVDRTPNPNPELIQTSFPLILSLSASCSFSL